MLPEFVNLGVPGHFAQWEPTLLGHSVVLDAQLHSISIVVLEDYDYVAPCSWLVLRTSHGEHTEGEYHDHDRDPAIVSLFFPGFECFDGTVIYFS